MRKQSDEIYHSTEDLINNIINLSQLGELKENPHLNILLQYDQNSTITWRKTIDERTELRKQLSTSKEATNEFDKLWTNNHNVWEHLNPIIKYYAAILKKQDITGDLRSVEQIGNSYNGCINKYLLATAFYVADKINNNKLTAKNDYLDLNHLLYVGEDDTIVTNDNLIHLLHELIKKKGNAIRTDELMDREIIILD